MTDTKHPNIAGCLKRIPRFPQYAFSECGKVISFTRRKPFVMKPIKMGEYTGLQLVRADGELEKIYLHRAIAEAWHGPCPNGMVCRHLDGKKNNNSAINLAWGSQSQNNLDKERHGTAPHGQRNPMAKLTDEKVKLMKLRREQYGESFSRIAAKFNVSTMTAYRAITGQSWSKS